MTLNHIPGLGETTLENYTHYLILLRYYMKMLGFISVY